MQSSSHTEKSIQLLLMEYLLKEKEHILTLPNNKSVYRWEADLLSLTKSFLFHEFEIKISLPDYERDFSGSNKKITKHNIMKKETHSFGANYFWFVTTGFVPSWIPFYAGWIEIVGNTVKEMKPAPRLHTKSADVTQISKCLRSISFRLLNQSK